MSGDVDRKSWWILTANTLSFTVCFAVWMLNGVLIAFLVDHGIFKWGPVEMGWLIGIPVLTGAVFRLPLGVATDRWGGRLVNTVLLLVTAVPMFLLGSCNTYWQFFFASLGFGLAGSSFAVGIAYTSVWFPRRLHGTAVGIFGSGNAGAAL
ncbi:MAG: MFS transporter, partial [Phycisphaerales bacterium]|nr:MFS transporter [Phycisphaerales bacterium]